ncbi:unnamed protein product [Calypogeia fissa]
MRAVTTTHLLPLAASSSAPSRQRLQRVTASMDSMGGGGGNNHASPNRGDTYVSISTSSNSPTSAPSSIASPSVSNTIQFLTLCQRLKTTKRTGWVNHGLKESESIADHMYRMAIMALVLSDGVPGVNKDRCVKMAVVHDLAEAIVGDITPSDGVPKEEKSRMEREAMDQMCSMLGNGDAAQEMKELWQEYENNATPEAKLVKDFDKVEMILQAQEYEQQQGKHLEDFFRTTRGKFQTDVGKALAAEVVRRRPSTLKQQVESQNGPLKTSST